MDFLKQTSSHKIREVLRDTIMVLCQNSVLFETQLSVEAIIGITVDSSEILLVNIKEVMDKACVKQEVQKSAELGYTTEDANRSYGQFYGEGNQVMQQYDDMASGNVIQIEEDDEEFNTEEPFFNVKNEELDEYCGETESVLGNELVPVSSFKDMNFKQQVSSTNAKGSRQRSCISNAAMSRVGQSRNVKNANSFFCKLCNKSFSNKSIFLSHQKQHQQANTLTNSYPERYDPVKSDNFETEEFWAEGQSKEEQSSFSANEVQTVYTCNICGTMLRHFSSFKRHKEQHKGIVFRCQTCLKVFSRRDNLAKHQRSCGNFNSLETY